ncbi:hypothetical+protein [Methylocapsa aurea]|jgi:hypothetical protein
MAQHEHNEEIAVDDADQATLEAKCDHLIGLVYSRYGNTTSTIARVVSDDDIDRRFVELAGIPSRTRDDLDAKKALATAYTEFFVGRPNVLVVLLKSLCEDFDAVA